MVTFVSVLMSESVVIVSELAGKTVTYRDDSHLTRLEAVGALSAGYRRAAIKSITLQMHF